MPYAFLQISAAIFLHIKVTSVPYLPADVTFLCSVTHERRLVHLG